MGVEQALNDSDYESIESAVEIPAGPMVPRRIFAAPRTRHRDRADGRHAPHRGSDPRASGSSSALSTTYEGIGSRPAVRPAMPVGDADKRAEAIAQFNQLQAGLK